MWIFLLFNASANFINVYLKSAIDPVALETLSDGRRKWMKTWPSEKVVRPSLRFVTYLRNVSMLVSIGLAGVFIWIAANQNH
jgi:hypothetical protein